TRGNILTAQRNTIPRPGLSFMSIKGNSAKPSMAGKNLARRSTHHHYISGGLATIALGLFVAAAALAVAIPSIHNDPPASTPPRTPHHHCRSGRLATIALGLFVAAAALAVVKPSRHIDPPAFPQTRTTLPLPAPFPEASLKYSSPFIDETRIRPGDTVSALLQR